MEVVRLACGLRIDTSERKTCPYQGWHEDKCKETGLGPRILERKEDSQK